MTIVYDKELSKLAVEHKLQDHYNVLSVVVYKESCFDDGDHPFRFVLHAGEGRNQVLGFDRNEAEKTIQNIAMSGRPS